MRMRRNTTHGESSHSHTIPEPRTTILKYHYTRVPQKIIVRDSSGGRGIADGGSHSAFVLEGELLLPNTGFHSTSSSPSTICIFMHPANIMNMLPFPSALARAGCDVMICHSRYANFDYNLILEHCLHDLGCVVKHCTEKLMYDKVVLIGWSGGGSLMTYYQSEAESPCLNFDLRPADAMITIAAHAGRARILTECLDPSIWLHRRRRDLNVISKNLSKNLEEFNLYSNEYQLNPELLKERLSSSKFLHRFRTAQKERNMRITKWAKLNPTTAFTLDGTMMDPRWIFPTIDPNDRIQSWDSYLGDPRVANDIPTGLARFSTGLSWLSQWSLEESKGDAVHHMTNVTVPTLVVENGADNGCPRPHMEEMFASCASEDKKYVCICNAFHYFQGQKDKLEEAACTVVDWLMERELFLQSGEEKEVEEVEEEDNEDCLQRLRDTYNGSQSMEISGFNHLALVSGDMERTCQFYGGVLGLKLSKTVVLPGGGQHFFFNLSGTSTDAAHAPQSMAFFWFPDAPAPQPGITAPSMQQLLASGRHPSAHGSMNHVAFNVPENLLQKYQKRIADSSLCSFCSPIVYHADTKMGIAMKRNHPAVTWASVYFFGPDGELLEISSQVSKFNDREKHVAHLPQKALWRRSKVSKL